MLQCQIISHFCSKCCLVLCPFRVQPLGKYTSLPWWYVWEDAGVKKSSLQSCFLWTFLTLTNLQTVRSKLNLLFVDLEGSESWDQMKCCSSKKVNPVLESFYFKPYIVNCMAGFRTAISSSESYDWHKICKSSDPQNSTRDMTSSN